MKNPLRLLPIVIPAGNISVFLDYRQRIALLLEKFLGSDEP